MAQLIPYSRFRAVGDDNLPLVGGKVFAYVPGTSTPKDTYTDHTLGTPNANPVILDAAGEATIFISGDTDVTLTDADEVQSWGPIRASDATVNGTLTNATLAGTLTVTSTAVTWSGNPTHSGNHTFTNNVTVNGNATLGNASTDTLIIAPNAVTWSNNPTHSGSHTFEGVVTFDETPSGKLASGAYTPTQTSVTNVSSSTAAVCPWTRSGDVVTVFGSCDIGTTATGTTELGISLPIASSFAAEANCAGTAATTGSLGLVPQAYGAIRGDAANDRAALKFTSPASGVNFAFSFSFSYRVL
jgi:hypothetical protein